MADPTPHLACHPLGTSSNALEPADGPGPNRFGGVEAVRGRVNSPEIRQKTKSLHRNPRATPLDGTETAAELARRLRSALAPRCSVCGRYVRPTCGRCSGRCHTRAHRRRRRLQTNSAGVAG